MADPRPLICPRCSRLLQREDVKREDIQAPWFPCPYCAAPLRFSRLPVLIAYLLSFSASLILSQVAGLKAYQAPLWIPIFVVCFLFAVNMTSPLFSPLRVDTGPRLKSAVERNLVLFLCFWFAFVVTAIVYGFVLGWAAFFVGGSRRDIREITDLWSVPFGLINPAFVVRPEKSLVAVIGIVSANCYFWALGMTLVYKAVHHLLRRNKVTELGISGTTLSDDDEV